MTGRCYARRRTAVAVAAALALLGGCTTLNRIATPAQHPTHYSLATDAGAPARPQATATTALTLIVNPPQAAAGYDSPHMMYARRPDQLERFAHNEWIDTPSRMLEPLIVSAISSRGVFRAVVPTPSPAVGDMRLETEILRLQQEFMTKPSEVRFGLRAYLVETRTRGVVAAREFEALVPAPSDDPRGGVSAARAAVGKVLAELAEFCAQNAKLQR